MIQRKRRETMFYPGVIYGSWVLEKWLGTKGSKECWLARDKVHNHTKSISIDLKQFPAAIVEKAMSSPIENVIFERFTGDEFSQGNIVDDWILDEVLGGGAYSVVWSAHRQTDNKHGVLKIFNSPHLFKFKKFCNEALSFKRLKQHRLTPPLIDMHVGENIDDNEHNWIAMEAVDIVFTAENQPKTLSQLVDYVIIYTQLLQQIAAQGVYYGDLKLEHLARYRDSYVLIDFDSAIIDSCEDAKNGIVIPGQLQVFIKKISQEIKEYLEKTNITYDNFLIWLDELKEVSTMDEFVDFFQKWQQLNELDPAPPNAISHRLAKAQALLNKKNVDAAIKAYEGILSEAPNSPNSHYGLGIALKAQGDYLQAQVQLKNAAETKPNNCDYAIGLAETHLYLKQFSEAKEVCEKIIALEPYATRAYEIIALTQKMLAPEETIKPASLTLSEAQKNILHGPLIASLQLQQSAGQCLLFKDAHCTDPTFSENLSEFLPSALSQGCYRSIYESGRYPTPAILWQLFFKQLNLVKYLLSTKVSQLSLLEIQCGSSPIRDYLQNNMDIESAQRFYYWGVDESLKQLEHTLQHHNKIEHVYELPSAFIHCTLNNPLPFEDSSFDCIVHNDTNNALELGELSRLLKPQGALFLTVDGSTNTQRLLMSSELVLVSDFGYQADYADLAPHINAQHKPLVDALSVIYPKEMVSALLTPVYPECAKQRILHLQKTSSSPA